MENTITVKDPQSTALAPLKMQDLLAQLALVQEVMKTVMKDGEHYGEIPGTKKKSLFKSGAEKLCFVFRLAPTYVIEEHASNERGHREYRVKCRLHTIGTNMFVAEGEGSATTMEAKYRFRIGPRKPTGKPVPKEFWDLRAVNPTKAQDLLGGPGYGTAKNTAGEWEICEIGTRIEHENPADYYNTVLKMAQKRAHIAATLTATAASDIFAQDLEDLRENEKAYEDLDSEAPESPASGSQLLVTKVERPTSPAAESNAAQQTQAPTSKAASGGSRWRDFPVPKYISKYAGRKLGEMEETDLGYWIGKYEPRGVGGRPPSQQDRDFRKALDEAKSEMRAHAAETVEKIDQKLADSSTPAPQTPRPANAAIDEDVPF